MVTVKIQPAISLSHIAHGCCCILMSMSMILPSTTWAFGVQPIMHTHFGSALRVQASIFQGNCQSRRCTSDRSNGRSVCLLASTTTPPPMNKNNETQVENATVLLSPSSSLSSSPLSTGESNGHQQHHAPSISIADNDDSDDIDNDILYFSDVYDLNQALNRFAEVAADPRQPVIRRAAVAEQLWKDHVDAWNNRPRGDYRNLESQQQQQQQQQRVILARPDIVSFNTVLKAWARAAHALSLNHQLQSYDYEGTTAAAAATTTTNNVAASTSSTSVTAVDKDHEYLRRVISNNVPHLLERYYSLDPMVPVFTAKDCAMRATNLLQQQEEKLAKLQQQQQHDHDDDDDHGSSAPNTNIIINKRLIRPDMSSYNTCLDAWAKSHAKEALPQAHALLAQMSSIQAHDKSRHLNPDIFSYNSLLDACSHYETKMDVIDTNPEAKTIGEESTNTMMMMDHRLVETLRIRRLLESSTEARLRPTIRTYNSILHVYSRVAAAATWNGKNKQVYEEEAGRLGRAALELLDEVKQKSAAAAAAAAAIQEEEHELVVVENDDDNDDSDARLHKNRARHIKPDVITYSSVMDVLSKVGKPWATNAAADLLQELKQHPELEPTPYSYTTLISAWSRTPVPQAPQEAEALLNELLEKYWTKTSTSTTSSTSKEFNGDKNDVGNMTPNHRPFTATLHTLARSRQGNKAVKGLELLQRMKQVARGGDNAAAAATSGENNSNSKWLFPPSRAAYHAALDCCSRTTDHRYQDAAMRIAFAIFKDMNGMTSPVTPNSVTFNKLLRCISELWPASEERNRVASVVFQKAKAAGQVDPSVLLALQKSVDAELLQTLLGSDLCNHKGSINFQRIPAAWSHHVRA